jgi:hypothetical protein
MAIEFPSPRSLEADERMTEELARYNLELGQEIPDLYNSGIVYRAEPRNQDEWTPWTEVARRGYGDCEDLVGWLLAWLWQRGAEARSLAHSAPGYGWHQTVVYPDGQIEDPSRALRPGGWVDLLSAVENDGSVSIPYEYTEDDSVHTGQLDCELTNTGWGFGALPMLARIPALLPPLARVILAADSVINKPLDEIDNPILRKLVSRAREKVPGYRTKEKMHDHRTGVPSWVMGPISPISGFKAVYMSGLKRSKSAPREAILDTVLSSVLE